jgi:CzcA family heavy metal efflux pump
VLKYLSERIYLTLIILLLFIMGGIYTAIQLSVDIFPNLNYPLLNIITHYTGGSPEDIEVLITRPIENQMSALNHVRRISSISREGLSQVTVEFDWGVSVRDAWQMVSQALSIAVAELPEGAIPVIENLGSSLQEIMGLGIILTSKEIDLSQLKYVIRKKIANHLKSIKGVYRVEIIGGEEEAFIISSNIKALMKYKITLSQIKSIINANNFQIMASYIEKEYQDYAVRGVGNVRNIEDLKNIVIKKINGIPIFLKDVACIKKGYLPQRYTVYINGKPGIALSIFKNKNMSTLKVAKAVSERLGKIIKLIPNGVHITKYYDQSEIIQEAISNLKRDILAGGFLVIIVLLIFIGRIRDALLIALTIPIIIIISFFLFPIEHLSLNMITLGAMAVAVGMIVDDSIIVLENILRHRESGKPIFKAVTEGTKEILGADVSGTLTTVVAFIPFIFLSGLAGRFTTSFGLVIVTTLLASLIVSLSFIPLMLTKGADYKPCRPIAEKILDWFIKLNQEILKRFLNHKKAIIMLIFLIFIFSAGTLVFSPISFLPQVDEGAILLEYILPPGTSLNESNRIGEILENIALRDQDVDTVYRRTGSEAGTYQVEPVNRGELVIKLSSRKSRKRQIFEIIKDLKKLTDQIPGVITLYHQVTSEKIDESLSGLPTIFGITIYGENYNKLIKYAERIEEVASHTKGIGNIINNTKYRVPEFRIRTIPDRISQYGLSSKEIMEELMFYLGGKVISTVIKGEKNIPIFLKADENIKSIEDIKHLPIKIGKRYIPMSQLIHISTSLGADKITHINLQREVTLPMEIEGSMRGIVNRLKTKIEKLHLPKNYFVEFGGQYQLFIEMLKKIIFFGIISILLVYFIMSIQFGNCIHPLAIMIEIPFSFIGAFLAISISRQPLNLSFFIGLITLIGVSVNNGIVLVDYINKKRKQGMGRKEAIEESTRIRTRPILLTALTSVLALFPISLGIGIGSKIHQPLAISVMGGLLVNTLLTLNVLPVVYCFVEDLFKKNTKSGEV